MEFRRAALDVGEIILYSSLHLCPPLFSYLLRPPLAWLTLRISFPVSGHTHIIDSPLGWIRRVNETLEGTPSPELKWKLWNLWTWDKVRIIFTRYHTVLSFIHRLGFRPRLFFALRWLGWRMGMEFHVVVQRVIPRSSFLPSSVGCWTFSEEFYTLPELGQMDC